MKKYSIILFILTGVTLAACNKSQSSLQTEISEMEKSVSATSTIDTVNCDSLISLYKNYCELYKDDTICADYFFRAAETSIQLGKYQQAIEFFGNTQRFPVYRKVARALFMQGFIAENNLKDKNAAREYYNRFLIKFPNHKMASEVKMLIQSLNLTDEMLIQNLKRQNDTISNPN
jgi:outer membrane protein assembly factor BamD (BamD/ComL family)